MPGAQASPAQHCPPGSAGGAPDLQPWPLKRRDQVVPALQELHQKVQKQTETATLIKEVKRRRTGRLSSVMVLLPPPHGRSHPLGTRRSESRAALPARRWLIRHITDTIKCGTTGWKRGATA